MSIQNSFLSCDKVIRAVCRIYSTNETQFQDFLNISYEELFRLFQIYDSNKTHLQFYRLVEVCVKHKIINELKRNKRELFLEDTKKSLLPLNNVTPESQLLFKDALLNLSNDAQFILQEIFKAPKAFLTTCNLYTPRYGRRSSVINFLNRKGWSQRRIKKSIKEITSII